ncbi:PREDICTED: uncharacterized protein LOC109153908 [Ipomoea nil]|uniref:uncharacterized protein LOC109153908 n=1 Tax=Ipomoea nil TaxID=35883 RepID=UPI0009009007|nr:PREDICTED: uncharacterized protein LOC109153908 [Ipomoea nil]
MALFRLVVVAALLLLEAWASQATAHNNHVNKPNLKYMTDNPNRNPYSRPPKKSSPKSSGGNSNNNGGNPTTQMPNPSFNNVVNTADAINNVVETTTEAMAEPPPPPPPESSGACDGNDRAFGGWFAVIIAVSLCYHHLLS